MAQPSPIAMFNYGLNPVRGFTPASPWALSKTLAANASAPVALQSGMVAYQEAATKTWMPGVLTPTLTAGAVGVAAIPFFLFQNGNDYDVVGTQGNIVGLGDSFGADGQVDPDIQAAGIVAGTIGVGQITGFAANLAAELETVQFDTTSSASAYAPNTLLTSATTGAKAGQLAPWTVPAIAAPWAVCGVVSDGVKATDMTQSNNSAGPVPVAPAALNTAVSRSNPLVLRFHSIFNFGR